MTDLARLVVRLEADNARLQKDLDKAQSQINKFKASASSAFSKIVPTIDVYNLSKDVFKFLGNLTTGVIKVADEFSLLAQKTGISAEALSQLSYAADQAGIEDLAGDLVKFNKSISDAAQGSKAQADAFKALGINVKDVAGNLKPTEQLFNETADALAKYRDGANKTAVVLDLFGKSGAELIPLLNQGSAGIAKFREEADKLGLTISTETAQAANDFNDSLDKIKYSVAGVGRQLVTDLTPRMREFADFMSDPQTISNLAKFGEAIVESLGAAVTTVTALTSGVSRLYGALSNSPPTELVDVLDEISTLEGKLSGQEVEQAKKRLAELIALRDKLFAKQREDLNRPAPTTPGPAPDINRVDTAAVAEAAKKAAELRKKIAEASAQAETTIFNAGLDRRQSALEAALALQKITQEQYYKKLEAIQQEAIDQEIKQRSAELATADPAEGIKLLAEIAALQTKRRQISEDTDEKIAESNKKLTDALTSDLAAYADQLNTLAKTYLRARDDFGKGPAQRRFDEGRNSIDDNVSQQRIGLENQRRSGDITQSQYDDSLKALEAFHSLAIKQWDDYFAQIEAKSKDFSLGFKEAFLEYADAVKNVGQSLGQDLTGALQNAIDQTAELAANTILWGEGGEKALKALGRSIITDVVSSLIKAGIQMVVNAALGKALGAASLTATAAEATASAALWSPAAVAASIATFGAADAVGLSAYITSLASGQAATLASSAAGGAGFSEGGFTGYGPVNQVAGQVHRGEGVVSAGTLSAAAKAINDPNFWSVSRNASRAMTAGQAQVNIINQPGIVTIRQDDGTLLNRLAPALLEMVDVDQAGRATSGRGQHVQALGNKFGLQGRAVR